MKKIQKLIAGVPITGDARFHVGPETAAGILKALRANGFTIIEVKKLAGLRKNVEDMLAMLPTKR